MSAATNRVRVRVLRSQRVLAHLLLFESCAPQLRLLLNGNGHGPTPLVDARGRFATTRAMGADPLGPNSVRGGVWTPYGGWFPDPKHWRRHTLGGFVALGALSFATWNFSRAREQRPIYPAHPIPSQRWSNAFDENGPRAT